VSVVMLGVAVGLALWVLGGCVARIRAAVGVAAHGEVLGSAVSFHHRAYQYLHRCEYVATTDTVSCMATRRRSQTQTPAPHPDALSDAQVAAAVRSFALLADPTRVRMLWALREAEHDVATLAETADCRPTVASQHLSKLRFAGLVEGHRQGQRVIYRLRGRHVRNLLAQALLHADHQVTGEPTHD